MDIVISNDVRIKESGKKFYNYLNTHLKQNVICLFKICNDYPDKCHIVSLLKTNEATKKLLKDCPIITRHYITDYFENLINCYPKPCKIIIYSKSLIKDASDSKNSPIICNLHSDNYENHLIFNDNLSVNVNSLKDIIKQRFNSRINDNRPTRILFDRINNVITTRDNLFNELDINFAIFSDVIDNPDSKEKYVNLLNELIHKIPLQQENELLKSIDDFKYSLSREEIEYLWDNFPFEFKIIWDSLSYIDFLLAITSVWQQIAPSIDYNQLLFEALKTPKNSKPYKTPLSALMHKDKYNGKDVTTEIINDWFSSYNLPDYTKNRFYTFMSNYNNNSSINIFLNQNALNSRFISLFKAINVESRLYNYGVLSSLSDTDAYPPRALWIGKFSNKFIELGTNINRNIDLKDFNKEKWFLTDWDYFFGNDGAFTEIFKKQDPPNNMINISYTNLNNNLIKLEIDFNLIKEIDKFGGNITLFKKFKNWGKEFYYELNGETHYIYPTTNSSLKESETNIKSYKITWILKDYLDER